MSATKIFVVLGATGAQGKSVVSAIAAFNRKNPSRAFKIRGVARRVDTDAAKQLLAEQKDYLELVSGDMTKREDLDRVFAGATHLFAVTQFWDPASMGKEVSIGTEIGNAAKKAGISYVWWSSLENVEKISGGKLHVPHFTDKKKVEEKLKELGLKVIAVNPAYYYSNWTTFFPPKRAEGQANVLEWNVPLKPDTKLSAFAVEDMGLVVGGTLDNPDDYVGKIIPIVGDNLPVIEYLDIIAKGFGATAKLNYVPYETFAKFGFPAAEEVAHMCEWFNQYGYHGPSADLEWSRKVAPQLQRFADWFEKNKSTFKIN